MSEPRHDETPLDLSVFDGLDAPAPPRQSSSSAVVTDPSLAPEPPPPRLVEIGGLSPADRAADRSASARIAFGQSATLLAHGDEVLAAIARSSRTLLDGVRLGDAGDVGRIAASVIDGVKILRIEDLRAEAAKGGSHPSRSLVSRLVGAATDARSAFRGFSENRRRFLDLMDDEEARARRIKADLAVAIDLLDEQAEAIRRSLHGLKIEIAAGQIALDRGHAELERRRQAAVRSGDPTEAADVLSFRGALANFRGKVAELREALVGSAMLIPIVAQNRQAAETRLMKISNGMLVVIPRLMAVASQAVVQVDIGRAAAEAGKLDEAARQVTLLASRGAHDAATEAARSLGGDTRNVDVLAAVADEAIRTMHEVIEIERAVADADRERENRLVAIRDRLVTGMQGVHQHAIAP